MESGQLSARERWHYVELRVSAEGRGVQFPDAIRQAVGETVQLEYRRGVEQNTWQRLWHFNELCRSYPTRNFALRKDKPSEDELCARCCSAPD